MKKQYLAPNMDMFRYAAESAIANGSGGYEAPALPKEDDDNMGSDIF